MLFSGRRRPELQGRRFVVFIRDVFFQRTLKDTKDPTKAWEAQNGWTPLTMAAFHDRKECVEVPFMSHSSGH